MAEQKSSEEGTKRIRLVWDFGDEVGQSYANHLFVSFAGGTEFHVVFGHLAPPLVLDNGAFPDDLKIKPVAKLIITPTVMEAFLQVLNDSWRKFEKMATEMDDSNA